MTEPLKRPRGRPKGSGKDDSALLATVADLLLAESIKPTTAMKRVIRQSIQKGTLKESAEAATLRRLQEKWVMSHETLEAQAQLRLDVKKKEQERRQRRTGSEGGGLGYGAFMGTGSVWSDPTSHYLSGQAIQYARTQADFNHLLNGNLSPTQDLGLMASQTLAKSAYSDYATQLLSQKDSAWEAMEKHEALLRKIQYEDKLMKIMKEQDMINKIITGNYDPITGRFR